MALTAAGTGIAYLAGHIHGSKEAGDDEQGFAEVFTGSLTAGVAVMIVTLILAFIESSSAATLFGDLFTGLQGNLLMTSISAGLTAFFGVLGGLVLQSSIDGIQMWLRSIM